MDMNNYRVQEDINKELKKDNIIFRLNGVYEYTEGGNVHSINLKQDDRFQKISY